ncbi:unnamed protein product [Clonostachys rosea]|uniref:Uncharacterized protein n=1 Tax=Bionectria ochroleuca TaxID=29856 RepID=A0ABY6TRM0_BIOOC|nr:unnamed protein product [Clonostachys rosea]
MCTFRLLVEQCGCNDIECKQMNPEIQDDKFENVESGGHVYRVVEFYRLSGYCMGYFSNKDPNRMMVARYGMDPNNGNSTQDCPNKVFVFDEKRYYSDRVCEACRATCEQPDEKRKRVEPNPADEVCDEVEARISGPCANFEH